MDARKLVGLNVRRLRVERGYSQERLALDAGIDRAYVGRIERGAENVTIARLEAIANVLQVPIAVLFEEAAVGMETPLALRPGRKPKAG